jgi:ribosomal RNA-processing protein 17
MKKRSKGKNELVFDNQKREDFLKGFSKRKKQRQKKAQEEIEVKLKEERKKIKEEASRKQSRLKIPSK